MQLEWRQLLDLYGNTFYLANTPEKEYVIQPVVRDDKIQWVTSLSADRSFTSIPSAQSYCADHYYRNYCKPTPEALLNWLVGKMESSYDGSYTWLLSIPMQRARDVASYRRMDDIIAAYKHDMEATAGG